MERINVVQELGNSGSNLRYYLCLKCNSLLEYFIVLNSVEFY